jgi:molybdate transport system permease protein
MSEWLPTPAEWSAIRLSLMVALTATAASLPAGIGVGYLLARKEFLGKSLIETLLSLPLVLPPVVTGYLLLVLFGRRAPVGAWLEAWFGIELVFTWQGAALASAVMGFPLMVRSIRIAFAAVDPRLELAARTLGAGPAEAFVRIALPLARRGVIAGAVLAFARSVGEFGATIMIAGNIPGATQTIPLYIYSEANAPGGIEASLRLVLASILVAAAALAISEYMQRAPRDRPAASGT